MTASRVEASLDVDACSALDDSQKRRLRKAIGERVSAVAQDTRSQARNRELALERLAGRIAAALHRPKRRRPTRPSRSARERRLDSKRRRSQRKAQRRRPEPE